MRYSLIVLILGCLCISLAEANDAFCKILEPRPTKGVIYNLLMAFLNSCGLNPKKIIIYDPIFTQDTFSTLAEIQPQMSVSLFSDSVKLKQIRRYQFDDLELNTVIIVIDVNNAWDIIDNLFTNWRYNWNCTIYMFPDPWYDCGSYRNILELIMRFYFSEAYYVCSMDGHHIHVYTHDPYGDTIPQHWNKISQELLWGKNWTFYNRSISADSNINQLCPGLNFKRTDPSNQSFVILTLRDARIKLKSRPTEEKLFGSEIEENIVSVANQQTTVLKKLLNVQFNYLLVPLKTINLTKHAYKNSGVDGSILVRSIMIENSRWHYFYPVTLDSIVIISHNRGPMTPLEKIAKFYGIWTLSSLTLILSMTFIAVWMRTKKISLAAFDVIRLLINTEIVVPINTGSRKIFFSMIFLYFLIIHATFSGHLAEFLTSIDNRRNVETLDDLKDPRIEKIYRFGYEYDSAKELEVLRQKTERIRHSVQCWRIQNRLNSACIAPTIVINDFLTNAQNNTDNFYISKNTFGFTLIASTHRPGFPLRDRFNWAFMFLFDTDIIDQLIKHHMRKVRTKDAKKSAKTKAQHRAITRNDLHFAFILLIMGNCAAFICFLFEICFRNINNTLKSRYRRNLSRIEVF